MQVSQGNRKKDGTIFILDFRQSKILTAGCLKQQSVENVMMIRVYLVWLLALILLVPVNSQGNPLPAGCYESNYTSTFTRCDLSFLFCYSRRILQSCHLRKCERYVRAGDCYLETSFVLDQLSCYRTCCGSDTYNEEICNKYNVQSEQRKDTTQTSISIGNSVLKVVLAIIAAVLLFFVVWYSIKKMKCCDKSQQFKLIKFNIKWRKDEYVDCKCEVCRTYGPLLVTPCEHSFHISCFQESVKDMNCPKCLTPIKDRIKIYCFNCRERSFKVKVFRVIDIAEAITQAKGLHVDLCSKEVRTHRKMLQSQDRL